MNGARFILTMVLTAAGAGFVALGSCQDTAGTVPSWGEQLPGKIVFVRNAGSDAELVQIEANGDRASVLPTPDDAVGILQPAWIGQGDRVAFTALTRGSWSRFEVATDDEDAHPTEVADAVQLVTRRRHASDLEVAHDGVYALDDGQRQRLVECSVDETPRVCANVRWGPDKRFVVLQRCGDADACEIIVASRERQESFILAEGKHPDWAW